jgi:hypothetical protein
MVKTWQEVLREYLSERREIERMRAARLTKPGQLWNISFDPGTTISYDDIVEAFNVFSIADIEALEARVRPKHSSVLALVKPVCR